MSRPRALTPEQAQAVAALCRRGESHKRIVKATGIPMATVKRISSGDSYSDVTGIEPGGAMGRRRSLTAAQALEVLARHQRGVPRLRIAKYFGVPRGVVDRIVTGNGYNDVTGIQPPLDVCDCKDCKEDDGRTRNKKRVRAVSAWVECVACHVRVRRTVGAILNSDGVTYCKACLRRQS